MQTELIMLEDNSSQPHVCMLFLTPGCVTIQVYSPIGRTRTLVLIWWKMTWFFVFSVVTVLFDVVQLCSQALLLLLSFPFCNSPAPMTTLAACASPTSPALTSPRASLRPTGEAAVVVVLSTCLWCCRWRRHAVRDAKRHNTPTQRPATCCCAVWCTLLKVVLCLFACRQIARMAQRNEVDITMHIGE